MTRVATVRILVLQPGLEGLDYRVPDGMALAPGDVVRVPLGPRQVTGVVWEPDHLPGTPAPPDKLRSVSARLEVPPLDARLRRLIDWTADYYMAQPPLVLRMALSVSSALETLPETVEYRLGERPPPRMTPQRAAALERLVGRQGNVRELAHWAGVSEAVVRGLIKAGALVREVIVADPPVKAPDPDHAVPALEPAQAQAAARLAARVGTGGFEAFLLDGVTGSGKTEVYFEAVAQALRQRRQVLILVPEIALTEPFLARFTARFGVEPVAWHSELRASQRRANWRAVAHGHAQVVVGARSALFLPYPRLGLIIVDEAHETSFKQEDGVLYHARDTAVMRATIEDVAIVLATATPAIETRVQAMRGRYTHLTLPDRFGGARLPAIATIDLRRLPPERGRWLAAPLLEAVKGTLARGEQALLFLNRRGYAPLTLCRACGARIECPNCTSWLVEHRLTRRLACHHCGFVTPPPAACPDCGAEASLVPVGPGVERIAEEVAQLLPDARTAVVTSDTIWSPAKARALIADVESHAVNLLIGTQLVTKGYHFPDLTLVGVVDADLGHGGGDLRASERTFQQIVQVAGRAGRAAKPGRVLLQTHQPDNAVIAALVSGDSEAFYTAEIEARQRAGMPPFGRLAALIVHGPDEAAVAATARALGRAAPRDVDGLFVLGPAPAPLSLLRGRHRHRLLVHARRSTEVQAMIRGWLARVEVPRSVRITIDVDPYSFV